MDDMRPPGFDTADAPPPTLAGKYRVERIIGEGAFGRVYLATDTVLRRPVAVKELLVPRNGTDPDTFRRHRERFEREARAGGAIIHPNVVTVHDLHTDATGNLHLVMEYVDGTNLRDLLVQAHALPAPRAAALALDIARALEAVHDAGIVHRDLKPANVMVSRRGVAKVGDFGVAQVGTESQRTDLPAALPAPAMHPGTPLYMSPEQTHGAGYVDDRSDLYSLGLILYELLTGERYLPRRVPLAAAKPDVPAPLAALVGALLAPDPARRPQHASEVVTRLATFTDTASPPFAAPESLAPTQEGLFTATRSPQPASRARVARVGGRRAGGAGRTRRAAGLAGLVALACAVLVAGVFAGRGATTATATVTTNAAIAPNGMRYPTPTILVTSLGRAPALLPTGGAAPSVPATRPAAPTAPTAPSTIAPRPAFASPTVPPPGTPPPGSVKLVPGQPLPAAPLPQVFAHPQGRYTFHYPQDAVSQPPDRLADALFSLDNGTMLVSVLSDSTPFRISEQELANGLVAGGDREREVIEANTVRIAGQPGVRVRYRTANERGVAFLYYVAAFSTENSVVYLQAVGDGDDAERFNRLLPMLDGIAASFTTGAKLTGAYADPMGRFAYRYPDGWRDVPPAAEGQLGRIAAGSATFHVSIMEDLGSFTLRDFFDRNLAALTHPDYGPKQFRRVADSEGIVSGQAARFLVFTGEVDGVPLEIHQWLFVRDGKGYTLTFRVPADKAREFADTGDVIAATFALR